MEKTPTIRWPPISKHLAIVGRENSLLTKINWLGVRRERQDKRSDPEIKSKQNCWLFFYFIDFFYVKELRALVQAHPYWSDNVLL